MNFILLILVITQIIAESLPISSSGHVALIELIIKKWWGVDGSLPDAIASSIHITALLAILIVFYKDWITPVKELLKSWWQLIFESKLSFAQKKLNLIFFKIVGLIFVADMITGIFYFFIKILFKDFSSSLGPVYLLAGFIVTAALLISLKYKKSNAQAHTILDLKRSVLLGAIQGIALLPGISRFAITYVSGCWLNLRPARAFQISFLLHFPLICAETFLLGIPKLGKLNFELDRGSIAPAAAINWLWRTGGITTGLVLILLATGCAVLFLDLCYKHVILADAGIQAKSATKNKLWWFGIYMLIPILLLAFSIYR